MTYKEEPMGTVPLEYPQITNLETEEWTKCRTNYLSMVPANGHKHVIDNTSQLPYSVGKTTKYSKYKTDKNLTLVGQQKLKR